MGNMIFKQDIVLTKDCCELQTEEENNRCKPETLVQQATTGLQECQVLLAKLKVHSPVPKPLENKSRNTVRLQIGVHVLKMQTLRFIHY